ncbi:MAG TPA: glycosyltransferase family 2 protein [Thermoanaerobaculia bacterium]|nr:glycosyltransferase family 2 protein [Thermoanaerobaculia bacterium]
MTVDAGRPELSILVPLTEHRGCAMEAVASFTKAQTCDGSRFEVVVLGDGRKPELEERVSALLRPVDRFVRAPLAKEMELYALGAAEARGALLLVTEPHCIASPHCVRELLASFESSPWDVTCLSFATRAENAVARMEGRAFDEVVGGWGKDDAWRRVLLRGFAIRKSVFLEMGGLSPRYEKFAERALAIRLARGGYRISSTPRAGITHVNTTSLGALSPVIREYVRGECAFRLDHPELDGGPFLGAPSEWTSPSPLRLARAFLARASAAARCVLWRAVRNEARLFRAYKSFWERSARLVRTECALAARRARTRAPETAPVPS